MVGASRIQRARGVFALLILLTASSFLSPPQPTLAQQAWSLPTPWSAQDIGNPAIAGSATSDQGTFTINAGGSDIGGRSDQFTFVYQQVSGDVDLSARVDSISAASSWSRTGVMIRSSLSASAANGFAFVSAGRGVDFQRRSTDGGMTNTTNGPSAMAPYWVRLVRKGTTVTAYSSANGTSWSTISSRSIALGATVYVGLATTSRSSSTPTTAVLSQVSVIPLSLPAPQQSADIGSPAIAGSASYRQGVYTIHAGGTDIGGTSDQFQFVYQPLAGDGEVIARVQSITNTNSGAKTGVMIRESLAADSRDAFVSSSAGAGYAFIRRIDPSGVSQSTSGSAGAAPGWVRLVRTGSQFDAYQSTDGANWTLIGSDAVPMVANVFVGIATTSHSATTATDAVLDNFKLTQGTTANQPPIVSITAPTDGSIFTAGKNIVVTAAANDSDGTVSRVNFFAGSTPLGSVAAAPYSVTWSAVPAGTYSLTAVAVDNDGASTTSTAISVRVDPAANQPPTVSLTAPANGATFTAPATVTLSATASDSDGTIAKVEFYNGATLLNADATAPYAFSWALVGAGTYIVKAIAYDNSGATTSSATATITVNGAANQPPTVTLTSPANNATFTAPASVSLAATATDTDGTIAKVEFYNGTTLLNTDTTAPYSFAWSSVAAGTYTVKAVAYDNAGATATSTSATMTVGSSTGVPAPWTAADIGSPALSGSSTYSAGVFSVDAGGVDIWGVSDQFHFIYQPISGDVDIVARVDSLTAVDPYTNAGVMIRGSLAAGSLHGYTALTGSNGVYLRTRTTNGGITTHIQSAIVTAPQWVRLVRQGTLVTSYWSRDGVTWTTIGSQTLSLGTTAYVGLAVCSHNATVRTSARFSNVSVTPASSQNPPTVALTAPTGGSTFTAPATVPMTATASDPNGTISRVEFYNGTTLLNSDTTAPYAFTWSSVAAGTYAIKAVAYDNSGASGSSSTATITVKGANQAPTVSLTAPTTGSTFAAPATVTMTATATDSDGTIAKVEFYNGTSLLNTDTTAPYSFTWSSVAAGAYTLKAIAYDNSGATATSATSTITVSQPTSTPPTGIAFTASPDHATLVTSYELRIYAAGANPSTATPLAITNLGKPTPDASNNITVDVSSFFVSLASGNYVAAVAAIGAGGSSVSAGVAFTR